MKYTKILSYQNLALATQYASSFIVVVLLYRFLDPSLLYKEPLQHLIIPLCEESHRI